MNARNMLKSLALALAFASSLALGGCTQRTIIEEPVANDDSSQPHLTAIADDEGEAIANHPLYVRSGETTLGEEQTGPFPDPWHQRTGPFPDPWHRLGDNSDDGTSPPPPSDPNPNPDPNHPKP